MLRSISELTDSIAPIEQPMRFGNKAFRTFHERLTSECDNLLLNAGVNDIELRQQLKPYLLDSFGNPSRIDYGTGHEIAFFAFLIVLVESGFMQLDESVGLSIFPAYIQLVRKITSKYTMEPAGSHGVWGLDDYHHLPFLLGAAQLIGHEEDMYPPREMIGKMMSGGSSQPPTLMFEYGVNHILATKCKHASFREVAPLLFDFLNRFDNWTLVCYGLMQLYKTEVLSKKPVMQHFYFSHYLPWEDAT